MELMVFIEHNWFTITVIISIITLTSKFTKIIEDYTKRLDDLKSDISDMKTETNKKFDDINDRLDNELKDRNRDKDDDKERTRLIMQGVEATLISLSNEGHNGPVTQSLMEINDYKNKKALE